MNEKSKTCCFTGHRIIKTEHKEIICQNLLKLITALAETGVCNFIAGGALGFDTLAANAVIEAREHNSDINLTLALPCKEQAKNWNLKNIKEYNNILSLADKVIYVSDDYYNGCMQKRNRYMIDNSDHCIFYMTSPRGGTAYTIKYAISSETNLHNVITGIANI